MSKTVTVEQLGLNQDVNVAIGPVTASNRLTIKQDADANDALDIFGDNLGCVIKLASDSTASAGYGFSVATNGELTGAIVVQRLSSSSANFLFGLRDVMGGNNVDLFASLTKSEFLMLDSGFFTGGGLGMFGGSTPADSTVAHNVYVDSGDDILKKKDKGVSGPVSIIQSDNILRLPAISAPANDGTNHQLFVDNGDGFLKIKDTSNVIKKIALEGDSVTFDTVNISSGQLKLSDTNETHDLIINMSTNLANDYTLNLVTPISGSNTLTIQGDTTLDDWFDQSVKVAATPTFSGEFIVGTSSLATGPNSTLDCVRDNRTTTGDAVNYVSGVTRQNSDTEALYLGNDGNGNVVIASNNKDMRFGRDLSGTFTEKMRLNNTQLDLLSGTVYAVSGTQVLGAQESAIANPSVGTAANNTAIISILGAMRTHGIIAT